MKKIIFTLSIFLNVCFLVSNSWSKSNQNAYSITCLPIDLCGTWVGCAKVNLSKKILLGTDYSAICRQASPMTTTIDEKTKTTYLTQTSCFRSQPINLPPPEKICPESCKTIPDCPSGEVHFAY